MDRNVCIQNAGLKKFYLNFKIKNINNHLFLLILQI